MDTSVEATEVQRQIWRKMSPTERTALAFEMSENARSIAASGIRKRHPEWSRDEVRLELIRLMHGESVYQAILASRKAA